MPYREPNIPLHRPHGDEFSSGQDEGIAPPRLSVLMAAYNAAPFIQAAIDSILGQTFTDFELVLVDDGSTDATLDIASSYADTRIRVLRSPRNLGVVAARNLGFAAVRGTYLAVHDADDISHPTRFARQVSHLDAHPGDVLVASDIRQLHPGGELTRTRYEGATTPLLLDWMLRLGNPIAFSSTMMRVAALRRLPCFLRDDRRYAEDFDLYTRLRAQGGIARLAMPLLVYRVYPSSTSARNKAQMVEQTGQVLADLWVSDARSVVESPHEAMLVARHLAGGEAAASAQVLEALRDLLDRLSSRFLASHPECGPAERDAILNYANTRWDQAVRISLRSGAVRWPPRALRRPASAAGLRTTFGMLASIARGTVPRRTRFVAGAGRGDGPATVHAAVPDALAGLASPALYATIVVEGAGDQAAGETRNNAAFALLAQAVFDKYGLRPAYLLDRGAASQAATCAALRNVQDAGRCAIGAWWEQGDGASDVHALLAAVRAASGNTDCFTASECLRNGGDEEAGLYALPVTDSMSVPRPRALGARRDRARSASLIANDTAARAQIALIRTLLARGERQFFLRLHLRQGSAGTAEALGRLRQVCAYFFEDLGGLPGDSRVLLRDLAPVAGTRMAAGPQPAAISGPARRQHATLA